MSLRELRDRGMTQAALGVGTNNLGGAFQLYTGLGFELQTYEAVHTKAESAETTAGDYVGLARSPLTTLMDVTVAIVADGIAMDGEEMLDRLRPSEHDLDPPTGLHNSTAR